MGVLRVLLLVLGVAIAGHGLVPAAMAQSFGRVVSPILTIDRERLFSDSLYGQRIIRELEAARADMAAETSRIEAALEAEERSLTEQRATLDPKAFRVLADAFDEKVQTLRAERKAADEDHTAQTEAARSAFFARIGPVLGALVRARGAVMILDSRAILLTAADVDITDAAIARIDAVLGDGTAAQEPEVLAPQTAPETSAPGPSAESPATPSDDSPVNSIPAPDQPISDPATAN